VALSVLPGLALTTVIAVLAMYVHRLPFAPFTVDQRHPIDALLVAILLGLVVRNVFPLGARMGAGIKYAVKKVLPFAIVLMGAKLDFFDVMRVSRQALLISLLCVVVALTLTIWLCKVTGVGQKLGLLIGIGTAICGGTAIAVTAPTIEADDKDTAFAITTITLFGVIAIFVFPPLGHALDLSQTEFGVWAGVAIHATPQVMAAGFAYGAEAGEIAVIVKLVRVLLLAPMLVGLGWWYAREKRRQQQAHVAPKTKFTTLFPPFILGFLALAVANTLNLLPDFTVHLRESALWAAGDLPISLSLAVTTVSGFLITIAMAGVGCGVHLKSLLGIGFRGLYVGLFAAVVLSGFGLGMLQLML
jgi:uncharacterized integral membrane protein (TIGR00698 family)